MREETACGLDMLPDGRVPTAENETTQAPGAMRWTYSLIPESTSRMML